MKLSLFVIVTFLCVATSQRAASNSELLERINPSSTFFSDKPALRELLTNFQDGLKNNPLTVAHANFFKGSKNGTFGRVYQLDKDLYSRPFVPSNLRYTTSAAVGYGLANTMVIAAGGKFIIVDTGSGLDDVKSRIAAFQQAGVFPLTDKLPIAALVFTHNHIDHTAGSLFWLQKSTLPRCPAEVEKAGVDGTYYVREDCVEVFGHVQITEGIVDTATRTGNIIDERSAYMYGSLFANNNTNGTSGNLNCGIGPKETGGGASYQAVSKSFSEWLDVRILGLQMWLRYAPSETNDEIVAFFPDATNSVNSVLLKREARSHHHRGVGSSCSKRNLQGVTVPSAAPSSPTVLGQGLLLSAEVIQGPSFPNLYSLRGTTFRNPLTWYESVDILRQFRAWAMVPSHGVPLVGSSNIETLLVNFRDAIQYVHDQSLRLFRLGFVPDEVVEMVQLPQQIEQNLASLVAGLPAGEGMDPLDYLRTFYGSVPQSVREIYVGYLGWNEGDPSLFKPLPPVERANRYLQAMGGAQNTFNLAQAAYNLGLSTGDKREFQWCAELLIYVIRAGGSLELLNRSRLLKAQALLQLAQTTSADASVNEKDWWSLNPNWRNWLVTGALELMLAVDNLSLPNIPSDGLIAPLTLQAVPPANWVQHWGWRYNVTNSQSKIAGKYFGFAFGPDATYWGPTTLRYIIQATPNVLRFIGSPDIVNTLWNSVDYAIGIPNYVAFGNVTLSDVVTPVNAFTIGLERLLDAGVLTRLRGPSNQEVAAFFNNENFDQINSVSPPIVGRFGPAN